MIHQLTGSLLDVCCLNFLLGTYEQVKGMKEEKTVRYRNTVESYAMNSTHVKGLVYQHVRVHRT